MHKIVLLFMLLGSLIFASSETEKIEKIKQLIKQHGLSFVIEKTIPFEQNEYPKKKNKLEVISSVLYLSNIKTKMYKISVVNNWEEIIVGNNNYTHKDVMRFYPQQMQQRSINSLCSYKLNRLFFKNGLTIKTVYNDENGNFLFSTSVNNEDCKTRKK